MNRAMQMIHLARLKGAKNLNPEPEGSIKFCMSALLCLCSLDIILNS